MSTWGTDIRINQDAVMMDVAISRSLLTHMRLGSSFVGCVCTAMRYDPGTFTADVDFRTLRKYTNITLRERASIKQN